MPRAAPHTPRSGRSPARAGLLLCAAVLVVAACGRDEPPPATPPPGSTDAAGTEPGGAEPATTVHATPCPDDPGEALAWVRAAHTAGEDAELRRRLDAWPLDAEAFRDAEETQVALTWRIRVALQEGRIEDAVAAWRQVLVRFDGHGVTPEGRGLMPDMIRLGLVDEARLLVRRRIEGARPDREGAEAAWQAGANLLTAHDAEEGDRLERARRWALWETFDRWLHALGLEPGPGLGRPEGDVPDARPYVVVVTDDFALGEVVFADVLARWLRDGAEARLTGVLVPIRRGEVRRGLRRVPAADAAEETAALAEDAAAIGLVPSWDTASGLLAEPLDDGAALAQALGLEGQESGVLVLDRRGRIVARLSGRGLDPRVLDPVIQKLVSR